MYVYKLGSASVNNCTYECYYVFPSDTYVMKLYDRSVDLAQFEEDTPLYPICRAWMQNQPHSRVMDPLDQPSSPEQHNTDSEEEVQVSCIN